jgi:hypothetical protein
VTSSTCSNGTCGNPTTTTQTQACSRSTAGAVCSSSESCGACSFSDYCTTVGARTCTEYYTTCASESCGASGGSSSYSDTCYRPAPPQSCTAPAPTYGSWSTCTGFSGTCGETGTQSRTVKTYSSSFNCATGTCQTSTSSTYTETQSCTRSTTDTVCQITPGTWSTCGGFSDYCDSTGTQTTMTEVRSCGGGSCSNSTYLPDSRSCTRVAPGPQSCSARSPTYGAWSTCNFNGTCSSTGTQSRSVTTYSSGSYNCATGQCDYTSSVSTETQTCTRTPPSGTCAPTQIGQWSACDNANACGQGTQTRTVTTYNCGSDACQPSSITETQACSGTTYPGYAVCGSVCTDVSQDSRNCGWCGRVCPYKYPFCSNGDCCHPSEDPDCY